MAMQAPAMLEARQDQAKTAPPVLDLPDTLMDGPPSGLVDFGVCDTTPGAHCSLAPPVGARLTPEQYTDLLRVRYRGDRGHRVHMAIFARRLHAGLRFAGPFVFEARKALEAIAK